MVKLSRFNLAYNVIEDRVRLTGESDQGESVVLWLTQRLLNRLVPELAQWSSTREKQEGRGADSVQFSAQGSVSAQVAAPSRVDLLPKPVNTSTDAPSWRIDSMTLRRGQGVALVFLSDGLAVAELVFDWARLRQWLALLHKAYQLAQWPEVGTVRMMSNEHTAVATRPEGVVLH